MSKKKKNKVAKLSDEEYGKYIMSLKDETPAKAIVPDDDEVKNKGK